MDLIFLVVLKCNAERNNQKVRCFNAVFFLSACHRYIRIYNIIRSNTLMRLDDMNRERKHFVGVFKKVSCHEKISSSKCSSTFQKEKHSPHTHTLTLTYAHSLSFVHTDTLFVLPQNVLSSLFQNFDSTAHSISSFCVSFFTSLSSCFSFLTSSWWWHSDHRNFFLWLFKEIIRNHTLN